MEALGRLFNVVPAANGIEIDMRDAEGVTFIVVGANAETFTVQESTSDAGAGAVDLDVINQYYTAANSDGGDAWVRTAERTPDAVVTTTTAAPVAVFHVSAASMSDGFRWIECTRSATGTVCAIVHDLAVQRTPPNLAILAA